MEQLEIRSLKKKREGEERDGKEFGPWPRQLNVLMVRVEQS